MFRIVVRLGPGLYIRDMENDRVYPSRIEATINMGNQTYLRVAKIISRSDYRAYSERWHVYEE